MYSPTYLLTSIETEKTVSHGNTRKHELIKLRFSAIDVKGSNQDWPSLTMEGGFEILLHSRISDEETIHQQAAGYEIGQRFKLTPI